MPRTIHTFLLTLVLACDPVVDTTSTTGNTSVDDPTVDTTPDGSTSDGSTTGMDSTGGSAVTEECMPVKPAEEGFPWGPCRPDHTCLEGFGCEYVVDPKLPLGSLCAPLCVDVSGGLACPFTDDAVNTCGEPLGKPHCEATTACALACETDDNCHPDLICSGGRCLWPQN